MKNLLQTLKLNNNYYDKYIQALTHSSYAYENNVESNERFEFLGDAVLELLMSNYLFKAYPKLDEGKLTKKRAQAVCEAALVYYADQIDLAKYIKVGKSLDDNGPNKAIIADAFEAVLGVCYLFEGLENTKMLFDKFVVPHLEEVFESRDYKSALQEIIQAGDKRNISYVITSEAGPSHNKRFEAVVKLDNKINLGSGVGKTKKEAEQKAAKDALKKGNYDFKTIS